jgi:hypothetical protein
MYLQEWALPCRGHLWWVGVRCVHPCCAGMTRCHCERGPAAAADQTWTCHVTDGSKHAVHQEMDSSEGRWKQQESRCITLATPRLNCHQQRLLLLTCHPPYSARTAAPSRAHASPPSAAAHPAAGCRCRARRSAVHSSCCCWPSAAWHTRQRQRLMVYQSGLHTCTRQRRKTALYCAVVHGHKTLIARTRARCTVGCAKGAAQHIPFQGCVVPTLRDTRPWAQTPRMLAGAANGSTGRACATAGCR